MRARLSLPHAGHQERGGLSGMGELLPAQGLVMFVDTLVCFCAHKVKQLMSRGAVGRVSTCSFGAQTTCYVFENITDFSECLIPVFTCIGICFLVPTSVHACTYIFSVHVFVHAPAHMLHTHSHTYAHMYADTHTHTCTHTESWKLCGYFFFS